MKKVFIYVDNIYTFGGAERVVTSLANELCKKYDVTIVSLLYIDQKPKFFIDERIKIINVLEFGERISLKKGIFSIRKRIKNKLKEYNPDVCIVACMIEFLKFPYTKKDFKIIGWEHSSSFRKDKKGNIIGRIIAKYTSNKVVVLTKKDMNNYINKLHYKSNMITQIYNILDEACLNNKPYDSNSKKIITVGRICSDKGFDILVNVAKKVLNKHNDWEWHIYGDTNINEDREQLVNLISESGLKDRLILKGFSNDIYNIYTKYSFYVMTSRNEGFPMCTLEAQGAKLPVISFDCNCGPSEQIIDEVNGYLIPCFDIDKMAEKINYLIDNPDVRLKMSSKTMEDKEKVLKEQVVKQWINIIED